MNTSSKALATRYDLMQLFPDQPTICGVEVGTDQGVLASDWLRHEPRLFLHTVDDWRMFAENMSDRSYAREQYQLNMKPFAGRYCHHELSSVVAARQMQAVQVDLAFIDAAHDKDNVRADLDAWYPMVKVGGYISGHDLDLPGVMLAVIPFMKKHRLNLQIINEHGSVEDHAKDNGITRPGSGLDRYGGWSHLSWYAKREK